MTETSLLPGASAAPGSDVASQWVADALAMSWATGVPELPAPLASLDALAGLALRRNPRRAHLLVSRVLGKHLPVEPAVALRAAADLASRIYAVVDSPVLVLGFAETATGLGQAVAAALPGAECVLSTRRPGAQTIVFAEEHSHAVGHRVLAPAAMLTRPRAVVLVDDELSSGRTAVNTIRALHAQSPHPAYVVASLLDVRPPEQRAAFAELSAELGVPVGAVSLLSGSVRLPTDAPERVADLVAGADAPLRLAPSWPATRVTAQWPAGVKLSARYGWGPADEDALAAHLVPLTERLRSKVSGASRVLVLGTEELMYAPLRLAAVLAEQHAADGASVRYQSTTRSPVAPLDREGYAVRCALSFRASDPTPDEPQRQSFVYNVRPDSADHIVVVTDGGVTAAMVEALRGCAPVTEVLLRDEVGS
ncbi:MAG TPA: phosphoribosyltransferase family protein [Frankiaceae bacterium]|jgi:adenine/guanine phosphoribosyltransferase-like PRPP-binding protein|nr:phosphoribosyltransferase family protein [Frankiaceae bacterium]